MVLTVDGEVHTNQEGQVFVDDLDLFVTVQLLEETLAVLSLAKFLRRPRMFLWVGQRSKATVDQRGEDNCMQNGQLGTSCRSRVIHQFWKQFVVNIDIAGFVVNKSSSRTRWRTSPTNVVRVTLWNPKQKIDDSRASDNRLRDLLEWLEVFTDNLKDTELHAPRTHFSGLRFGTSCESGIKIKEAQYSYSLPKRPKLRSLLANQKSRALCRRRTGEALHRAENLVTW